MQGSKTVIYKLKQARKVTLYQQHYANTAIIYTMSTNTQLYVSLTVHMKNFKKHKWYLF